MTDSARNIQAVSIEQEMRHSYLDYAMSVIVSRALPDVRDGLKPVHRRIMYAMHEMNNYHNKPYKKSARVVGDVIGKYHPHGNDAIYFALVRMAQDFSLFVPLVDGQGNFGSIDGDMPAAMRYTEVRLAKIATSLLYDIDFDTVDFTENYDGTEQEPVVLPAKFPNLLVNGASGIAVGMATNIPTHNLNEVLDGCIAFAKNPDIEMQELLDIIPAPDFPAGGVIINPARAKVALATGRGNIIIRSKIDFEEIAGRQAIIIQELPYQVNKAELCQTIQRLSKDKEIEGIHEIRDESNKQGIRVVIELKKEAIPTVILNQLYKFTQLQSSFSVNMLAINRKKPVLMNIKDIIEAFIDFRHEVVRRRITYLLDKARTRAHTLIGLYIGVTNIDEVIRLIKSSKDANEAKTLLMARAWPAHDVRVLLELVDDYRNALIEDECKFTLEQATAILEMRLQRLTGLELDKIRAELEELGAEIKDYLEILSSHENITDVIISELEEIKAAFPAPRRTQIESCDSEDIDMEDLIAKEEMVVTNTIEGYIKRVPLSVYRAQRRGGRGRSGMSAREDDAILDVMVCNTHDSLLFFSNTGKVYRMKVYKLPLATPQGKGRAIINLLPLQPDEKIDNITAVREGDKASDLSIVFATKNGYVRRNSITDFANIKSNGKIAIKLEDGNSLIGVRICRSNDHLLLATKHGQALRFAVDDNLRVFKSRASEGVRAIRLQDGDELISVSVLEDSKIEMHKRDEFLKIPIEARILYNQKQDESGLKEHLPDVLTLDEARQLATTEQFILTLTSNGYGKRTSAYDYRVAGRAGKGVVNISTAKNANVVGSIPVGHNDQLILLTNIGTLIRINVKDIRITGRSAMGVKLINVSDDEYVISVTKIIGEDSQDELEVQEELEGDIVESANEEV